MDTQAKQYLLCSVIEYAKNFSRARKRSSRLTTRDVEEAFYCLALRPLYSALELNGDETVVVNDFVCQEYESPAIGKFPLTVHPEAGWIDTLNSRENFRKRKISIQAHTCQQDLSENSRNYIQSVVSDALFDAVPPSDSDRLLAVWFMGLHFSETVLKGDADWLFVRSCIGFLDKTISVYTNMTRRASLEVCTLPESRIYPKYLIEPWIDGLQMIVQGKSVSLTESLEQLELIQEGCRLFIP